MNQHTKKFCDKYHITEDQYYGRKWILKFLTIDEDKIPKGFNPKIGGNLHLKNVKKISGNFNPVVSYDLYLNNLEEISGNFNPVVGDCLSLNSIKKLPPNISLTIGKDLYLNSLEEIPENFSLTIGYNLFLYRLEKLPKNFNPKVGGKILYGWMDRNKYMYNSYISINKPPSLLSWQNGKYIKVDGIFREVKWKRGKVYSLKNLYDNWGLFLVTDGKGTYSHGFTIKKAKEDLLFKINKNRNLESFKSLTLDSKLSYEKAIECYRVITGACEYGVKNFIETNNIKNKDYTIKEIIDLTKNQYGNNEFEQFFNK